MTAKPLNNFVLTLLLTLLLIGVLCASVSISAYAGQVGNARAAVIGPSYSLNNQDDVNAYASVNTSYHYKRGVEYFEAKEYDKAARSFRRVLREKPQDANANFYMARVNALRGDHKRAISNYNKSLRYYKNAPILLAGLGTSLVKVNKREQAKDVLARLEAASKQCNNVCSDAPALATSLHVVAMSLYPAQ